MKRTSFDELFEEGTKLLHRGQAVEALPLLEEAHELQPDHPDAAINLSGAYILTKRFKKAVPILEALSQEEPDNAMVWTNLGAAYLGNPVLAREEEQVRAIAAFERALEANPIAPNVAYNIGLIYRDRQEWKHAIYWFKKAIQADPADLDAHRILARLERGEGE
jgi:tetratricopeptide (TPR) repeat protein